MKVLPILGILWCAVALVFPLGAAAEQGRGSGSRVPVLMVHGSGLDAGSWDALKADLIASGWPRAYLSAVNLRPNDGANIAAAERQLRPAARSLLRKARRYAESTGRTSPQKLAVIGHSMGAVSGRWLAGHLIPEQVSVFISIAGANHGTNALCGHSGAGNREMCPAFASSSESPVQAALNGSDETPYGPARDSGAAAGRRPTETKCIAWYSIFIDPDEWIVPARSARLTGAGGPARPRLPAGVEQVSAGEFLVTSGVEHDYLPADPGVITLLKSLLSAGGGCGGR